MHNVVNACQTARETLRLHLEIVLDHHVQLLNVSVLSFSPDVHFRAEAYQFSKCLFKNLLVIDLDEESQLGGAT